MGDDESDPEKIFKREFKKLESAMHARITSFMDQLTTLANQQADLLKRVNNIDAASIVNTANVLSCDHDIKLLDNEIVALETYLATKDPELKKLIDKNIKAIKKATEKTKNGVQRKRDP